MLCGDCRPQSCTDVSGTTEQAENVCCCECECESLYSICYKARTCSGTDAKDQTYFKSGPWHKTSLVLDIRPGRKDRTYFLSPVRDIRPGRKDQTCFLNQVRDPNRKINEKK